MVVGYVISPKNTKRPPQILVERFGVLFILFIAIDAKGVGFPHTFSRKDMYLIHGLNFYKRRISSAYRTANEY